jgi:hypothetical protein
MEAGSFPAQKPLNKVGNYSFAKTPEQPAG